MIIGLISFYSLILTPLCLYHTQAHTNILYFLEIIVRDCVIFEETKSYRGISQQQLPGSCLVFDGGFWLKKSENPLYDLDYIFLTMEINETTYRDDTYLVYKIKHSSFTYAFLSFSRVLPFISRTLIIEYSLVLTTLTLFLWLQHPKIKIG